MTSEEATRVMRLLASCYPNSELSLENQVAYVDMLADLPCETGLAAVRKVAQTCRFFPSVAEIRTAADAIAVETYMTRPRLAYGGEMTNRERGEWADRLRQRADEMRDMQGGESFWSLYLRCAGDLMARNAAASSPEPMPPITELTGALMQDMGLQPPRSVALRRQCPQVKPYLEQLADLIAWQERQNEEMRARVSEEVPAPFADDAKELDADECEEKFDCPQG